MRIFRGSAESRLVRGIWVMIVFLSASFWINFRSLLIIIILNLIHFLHDVDDYIRFCMIFSSWHVNDHVYINKKESMAYIHSYLSNRWVLLTLTLVEYFEQETLFQRQKEVIFINKQNCFFGYRQSFVWKTDISVAMETFPCSGWKTCMGAHFPAVELKLTRTGLALCWSPSGGVRVLWHGSKWTRRFDRKSAKRQGMKWPSM